MSVDLKMMIALTEAAQVIKTELPLIREALQDIASDTSSIGLITTTPIHEGVEEHNVADLLLDATRLLKEIADSVDSVAANTH